MKKIFSLLLVFILILSLSGCFFYTEKVEKEGFFIAVNKFTNSCFVGYYNCTEYVENKEITIPDNYKNKPITKIGGYYGKGSPSPFRILLNELYINIPEGSKYHNTAYICDKKDLDKLFDNYKVQELTFVVNIGKNIKKIENVSNNDYYPHINEDDSITLYHPVVHINCSKENKYFYSENGKLYDKKTNELIDVFDYAS